MNYSNRFATPPAVLNLLIINALCFMATSMLPTSLSESIYTNFGLYYPESAHFRPWQLVTYMFLHGNFAHLFGNMFGLWMFGRTLEHDLGTRRFLIYYFVTGIGAALLQFGVSWIEISHLKDAAIQMGIDPYQSHAVMSRIDGLTIGASGAVMGILLAFGMMYPNAMIILLFPPIPMKAKYFVIIYGVLELFLGISHLNPGIAHFAHVGGMLWGFMLLWWWKRQGKIYY